MTPALPQKFKKLGYSFNRIVTYKIAEGVHAQIDGMLENGEQAVAVEVKTTLRQSDIDEHLVRMEKIRKYADEHKDKRQFMGAVAATITDKSTREYALKKGLFVIEPNGENVKVIKPLEEPRIWWVDNRLQYFRLLFWLSVDCPAAFVFFKRLKGQLDHSAVVGAES